MTEFHLNTVEISNNAVYAEFWNTLKPYSRDFHLPGEEYTNTSQTTQYNKNSIFRLGKNNFSNPAALG